MSNAADNSSNFPTMIIPKGTEIKINTHGQLSIKTPGNLVIQNSGTYSELESTNGSIRIEDNVNVEAVSVKAARIRPDLLELARHLRPLKQIIRINIK